MIGSYNFIVLNGKRHFISLQTVKNADKPTIKRKYRRPASQTLDFDLRYLPSRSFVIGKTSEASSPPLHYRSDAGNIITNQRTRTLSKNRRRWSSHIKVSREELFDAGFNSSYLTQQLHRRQSKTLGNWKQQTKTRNPDELVW